MPAIETLDLYQKALLWLVVSSDDYDEPTFGYPSVVDVRWIWKKGKVTDKQQNTTTLDAQVISNRDIPLRSIMWLAGTPGSPPPADPIADFSALQDAGITGLGLCRVETSNSTPDIKNRSLRSEFGLKRFRDQGMPIGYFAGSELYYAGSELQYAGAE